MDDKVYTPETISDNPFPGQVLQPVVETNPSSNGNHSPSQLSDRNMPTKRMAVEVIGAALNTSSRKILASFSFTEMGALQIGTYQNGISGDIKISPEGIVARDNAGNITFTLDGATGNATFAGIIQSGSIITGQVVVGDNNVIIDGENRRIIINDGTNDRVLIGYQAGGF